MKSVLLADIGGTNSRFALKGPSGRPERTRIIENDSVANLEGAIVRYLNESGARPDAAVLAVAAPLDGRDEIELTNRAWRFRPPELARRFGFAPLRVINDFEAIGWALSRLEDDDVLAMGERLPPRQGVRVVLGPGTGLGVAALVPVEGRLFVVSSEGGHASFGPQDADEVEVFARLQAEHGAVSAETILSGPGLVRLARAVDPATYHPAPESIVAAALAGDETAKLVAQMFVRLLGRFAGDIALIFKAFGGVYIAGGVASRLAPLIDEREFRAAFEAHPPYESLLKTIPTLRMSRSEPGLLGCAVLADELVLS
ncbi:MAG: glucokinase [Xanthobacteraceae bacterium]